MDDNAAIVFFLCLTLAALWADSADDKSMIFFFSLS